jgi:DNA-binding GntR family transcriptional regulator
MLDIAPPKSSLSENAYAEIRQALIQGDFEPGQRISEPELALRFSTSRSPIREALSRLEHEGFLERLPNGRVRVRALDVSELEQLYVVRSHVEGLAARLAAPRLRTIDLDQMERAQEEMERSIKKSDAFGATAAGQLFHDLLIRECGNEPLIEVLSGLRAKISRFRVLVASLGDYDPERAIEHRRILKSLYQRNADRAATEMMRHVDRSAAVLLSRLRKRR